LIICFMVVSLVSASWQSNSTPPANDAAAPLNIGLKNIDGTAIQIKAGDIGIHGLDYSWTSSQGAASTYLGNNGSGSLSWSPISLTALPNGTDGQTLRYNTGWVANSLLYNNGTSVGINTSNPSSSAKLDITGAIKITDGTQGITKVLTSDANGVAHWQTCPAGTQGAPGVQGACLNIVRCVKAGTYYSPGSSIVISAGNGNSGSGWPCVSLVCGSNGNWKLTGGECISETTGG